MINSTDFMASYVFLMTFIISLSRWTLKVCHKNKMLKHVKQLCHINTFLMQMFISFI